LEAWLSVVIPVHDGERWLSDALQSLVAQEQSDTIDCVVVDSSPGEGTAALVSSYRDRLRIRIFRRPDLEHWRSKTNFGFEQALATHVSMLHQDDFWLPGKASVMRAWMKAEPHAVMYLHPSIVVDERGKALGTWTCPLPVGTLLSRTCCLSGCLYRIS
jgi:glycosyltransferase involved in cell wall biosynthesis